MTFLLSVLLLASLVANGILIWYCRRVVKNLYYGIKNIDEFQNLLDQYADSMETLYELEQFYGDETIKSAITNTKVVIEACRVYKESIIDKQEQKIDDKQ